MLLLLIDQNRAGRVGAEQDKLDDYKVCDLIFRLRSISHPWHMELAAD